MSIIVLGLDKNRKKNPGNKCWTLASIAAAGKCAQVQVRGLGKRTVRPARGSWEEDVSRHIWLWQILNTMKMLPGVLFHCFTCLHEALTAYTFSALCWYFGDKIVNSDTSCGEKPIMGQVYNLLLEENVLFQVFWIINSFRYSCQWITTCKIWIEWKRVQLTCMKREKENGTARKQLTES